jgi:hypothetical protein
MIASARQRFSPLQVRSATFAEAQLRIADLATNDSQPLRLPVARPTH